MIKKSSNVNDSKSILKNKIKQNGITKNEKEILCVILREAKQ